MQSRRGWKRAAPGRSRTAIPEAAAYAISAVMIRRGQDEIALFNPSLFSTYLRPSGLMAIVTLDVLDAPPAVSHLKLCPALIVSPEEREARTKTGGFDMTVILDDVRDPELGAEWCQLWDFQLARDGVAADADVGEVPLWSFRAQEFSNAWRAVVDHLKLAVLCSTPCQGRHGGPSRDIQMKLRSLEEVQKRGHWKAQSSLRNYEEAGRLHKVVAAVPEAIMRYGESAG